MGTRPRWRWTISTGIGGVAPIPIETAVVRREIPSPAVHQNWGLDGVARFGRRLLAGGSSVRKRGTGYLLPSPSIGRWKGSRSIAREVPECDCRACALK